jgi:hypothetical protein
MMRSAAVAELGGFRPPQDPSASWAGAVRVALPDEGWPLQDGEPMLALLQVNVGDLPAVPPALDGIALATLFVGPRELPVHEPNGTKWAFRTYREAAGVIELDEPPPARAGDPKARKGDPGTYAALPIRWRVVEDYPSRDDWPFDRLAEYDALRDELGEDMPGPHDGIKIGGWPTTVQHEVDWGRLPATEAPGPADIEFVLQVDSDDRLGFGVGFGGVLYIGRSLVGGQETWHVDWQSM